MMSRVTRRALLRAALVGTAVVSLAACDRASSTEPRIRPPALRRGDTIVDDTTGITCRSGWEASDGRWICADP